MAIKNIDLETIYNKIGGRIDLIGNHLNDNIWPIVIKSCRLKPYSIFCNNFQSRTVYESHWVDEFGNSLKINNKIPKIILNDPQISKNTKISTDLFFGNSIDTVANNSQCVFVINGKNAAGCYLMAFYGKDEYLRCFLRNKKTIRVSPLLLGINSLREFFMHIHNIPRKDIDKNKLDSLINFEDIEYNVCWVPAKWKDYIKGDCI